MSIKKYKVTEEIELLEFLLSNIEGMSKNNIKSLLTNKNILVNGKVITKYNYKLKKGDTISISRKISSKVEILYEDDDMIGVLKPGGLLTIATASETQNTLYHQVLEYVKQTNKNNKIFIVHRLDKDTSGIVVFAKSERVKEILQNNWDKLVSRRGYIAIVHGITREEETIKTWLKETKTYRVFSSFKNNGGKEAITCYKKIKSNDEYSLLDIEIKTGRKNQIRVHMKDINHPILGDTKYGIEDKFKKMYLCAYVLELKHPITKKDVVIKIGIPLEYKKLVK